MIHRPFRSLRDLNGGPLRGPNRFTKIARGRKNDFFRNFLCCCTSTHQDKNLLLLQKFHIFSRSEKSKSVTNNKRTNKRTPQTIIIARQDAFRILGLIIIMNKYESSLKTNFIIQLKQTIYCIGNV